MPKITMKKSSVFWIIPLCLGLILYTSATSVIAANYEVKKIGDSIYAAVAIPGSKAVSNAMFIITNQGVILAGAHFVKEGVDELLKDIGEVTPLHVSHVILTHHHRGFNYVDFDLPEKAEIIVSSDTWHEIASETRAFRNTSLVFDDSITLNRGNRSLLVQSMGKGHSEGDVIVYLPKEGVLFASDLLFNDMVGYMGDASVLEWGEDLEQLLSMPARIIIPGVGNVTDGDGLLRFQQFFRAFMTEVLRNVESGNSLARTRREFSLEGYEKLPGFKTFLDVNLERAYIQLKSR